MRRTDRHLVRHRGRDHVGEVILLLRVLVLQAGEPGRRAVGNTMMPVLISRSAPRSAEVASFSSTMRLMLPRLRTMRHSHAGRRAQPSVTARPSSAAWRSVFFFGANQGARPRTAPGSGALGMRSAAGPAPARCPVPNCGSCVPPRPEIGMIPALRASALAAVTADRAEEQDARLRAVAEPAHARAKEPASERVRAPLARPSVRRTKTGKDDNIHSFQKSISKGQNDTTLGRVAPTGLGTPPWLW